jgi:hypothetical protein
VKQFMALVNEVAYTIFPRNSYMSQRGLPHELTDFISRVTTHFAKEAKRLRDPSVARESGNVLKFYFTSLQQLGTIQHEVALRALAEQLKLVECDARISRLSIWKRFLIRIKGRSLDTDDPIIEDAITSFRERLRDEDLDPEMGPALQKLIDAAVDVLAAERQSEMVSKELEGTLLAFDARMHLSIYTRLGIQRLVSFLGKHAFIVFGLVLVLGIVIRCRSRRPNASCEHSPLWHLGDTGYLVCRYNV